ncbi:MAG TPA: TIGR03435 family protein, partial [Candidatus Acidoferrales bacterium]|nr:TIGR03435 family protein [Candidatus Acidoferrales bacterium]
VSGPGWLATERYDIVAKTSSPASDHQLRLMLQTLLADRFQLTFHRETKELPVYLLVTGKRGAKLHGAASGGLSSMRPAGGGLEFRNFTMTELAERLSARPFSVDRPVLDETGLHGLFDFTMKLADNGAELKHTLEGMERGGSDFALFLEPLGLKLQPQKGPVEILVIDRAEKAPIGN